MQLVTASRKGMCFTQARKMLILLPYIMDQLQGANSNTSVAALPVLSNMLQLLEEKMPSLVALVLADKLQPLFDNVKLTRDWCPISRATGPVRGPGPCLCPLAWALVHATTAPVLCQGTLCLAVPRPWPCAKADPSLPLAAPCHSPPCSTCCGRGWEEQRARSGPGSEGQAMPNGCPFLSPHSAWGLWGSETCPPRRERQKSLGKPVLLLQDSPKFPSSLCTDLPWLGLPAMGGTMVAGPGLVLMCPVIVPSPVDAHTALAASPQPSTATAGSLSLALSPEDPSPCAGCWVPSAAPGLTCRTELAHCGAGLPGAVSHGLQVCLQLLRADLGMSISTSARLASLLTMGLGRLGLKSSSPASHQ